MSLKKLLTPRLFSYLFHPIVVPTLALLFFYFSDLIPGFNPNVQNHDFSAVIYVFAVTLICTLIIPLGSSLYLLKKGEILSLHMVNKEERFLPFAISASALFLGYYVLFELLSIESMILIQMFFMGSLFAVIFGMAITLKWKISVHMIGVGGFTGAVLLINAHVDEVLLFPLILLIMISGLVGYSRLHMKAHSGSQLVAGYLLGIACQMIFLIPIS